MTEKEIVPEGTPPEPGSEGGKVGKQFEANIEKISAVLGQAPDKKRRRRVSETALDGIIKDLYKEEDENLQKEFRAEFKTLLDGFVLLNEEFEKKQKEMDKLKEDKMKEFNQKAEKLFQRIDGLPARLAKFKEAYKAASAAAEGSK